LDKINGAGSAHSFRLDTRHIAHSLVDVAV